MRSSIIPALSLLLIASCLAAIPAIAGWPVDGLLVCNTPESQSDPRIVPDGAGGAIIAWLDGRAGQEHVYAQRVDGAGNPYWNEGGIPVTSGTGDDRLLAMVPDGAGGAIVVWLRDARDLYAQRLGADGALLWRSGGVWIRIDEPPFTLVADADDAGGVVMAWTQESAPFHVYAQKLDGAGTEVWAERGVAVSLAAGDPGAVRIVHDGMGGALIVYLAEYADYYITMCRRVYGSGSPWASAVSCGSNLTRQSEPAVSCDGAGSAIVVWRREAGTNYDEIQGQRLGPAGGKQWVNDGLVIIGGAWDKANPDVSTDGLGGGYVVWEDERMGGPYIYAQRFDDAGVLLWAEDVRLCEDSHAQVLPIILEQHAPYVPVSPASPGLFVCFLHARPEEPIYGQRLDTGGGLLWGPGAKELLRTVDIGSHPYDHALCGGAVIVTARNDLLMEFGEIWAQSVNWWGGVTTPAPAITGVEDVPGDQGGKLRISFARSDRDTLTQSVEPVSRYDVWQRVDGPAALAAISTGAAPHALGTPGGTEGSYGHASPRSDASNAPTIIECEGKRYLLAAPAGVFPKGAWELVGSLDATQSDQYTIRVSTVADSSATGIPWQVFAVSAHTTNPMVWFVSDPDSGYSVDNIPPAEPMGLAALQSFDPEGLDLTWDANVENDFDHYAVHRGADETFVPGSATLIAEPSDPAWFDGAWTWDSGYWYKVAAVDANGNGSPYAVLGPDMVTGDRPMPVPDATFLAQNRPNPFNPATTIAFGLREPGHVSLRIYDAAGRLVATLVDAHNPAGSYTVEWEGRRADGSAAASGVYFCRLKTGAFEETRKMILLR